MNMNNLISVYSTEMEEIGKGFIVKLGDEAPELIASSIDKVIESLYHLYRIDNNISIFDNVEKNQKELAASLVNLKLIKVITNVEQLKRGEQLFRSDIYTKFNTKKGSDQGKVMIIVE
ncbi:hypothetical protein [Enterococcus cecorum]|uniref:hypothetical protein n=1 Tax=Enterococcus cecorum TaxID=44008 RepID=UPI001FAC2272|nr:hypothetical protein [Enterococcus cecorum]MCJ0536967.1 hypothetical protein [Enterococcus cecorum]MCJ0547072.1 hypothetical protein [Enterococcus cecorum]MCJ0551231.1 hypothetical protein [Enterococcus cecorum]MCJ0570550.1 hypothetical protein [Enterococcus cecorum]